MLRTELGAGAADLAQLTPLPAATSNGDSITRVVRETGRSNEEAVRQYATALDALDLALPDDAVRCDLLLALAEAEIRAGESSAAKRTFLEAGEIARRLDLVQPLAHAALGYSGRIVWARPSGDDRLVPFLEEAMQPWGRLTRSSTLSCSLALLAHCGDEPTRQRRDALSGEALEVARRLGTPKALAYALDADRRDHRARHRRGVPRAEHRAARGRRQSRRQGAARRRPHAPGARAVDRRRCRRREGEPRCRRSNRRRTPSACPALAPGSQPRASRAGDGGFPPGRDVDGRSPTARRARQPPACDPHDRLQRYTLACFRGDVVSAEPLRELAAAYPARSVFRCAYANGLARAGLHGEAKALVDELAQNDFASLPFDQEWLYAMSLLAETCTLLGDRSTAAVLYRLMTPYGALSAVDVAEGFMGSMSRYLALLARVRGDLDAAARHFEAAIEMNEQMGARPWLAYTQHDYARLLEGSDPERAEQLLAEARAIHADLGMAEP